MAHEAFSRFAPQGPLTAIREGMAVHDRDDRAIGSVSEVYFGDETEEDRALGQEPATTEAMDDGNDSILGAVANVFRDGASLPETFRARLLREGYIAIDSRGFLARDRYATPDQTAAVQDDRVVLNVDREALIAAQ